MLPVIDKPAIQYVVEEAVARRHRRHPHHHQPRQARASRTTSTGPRARAPARPARARTTSSTRCGPLAELADFHYVRQGEPLGLGHAVSVARRPRRRRAVRGAAAPTTSWSTAARCSSAMIATHERARPLGGGAQEVPREEISPTAAPPPSRPRPTRLVASSASVEKPKPADAPVEPGRHGPLRVHARDLRRTSTRSSPATAARSS